MAFYQRFRSSLKHFWSNFSNKVSIYSSKVFQFSILQLVPFQASSGVPSRILWWIPMKFLCTGSNQIFLCTCFISSWDHSSYCLVSFCRCLVSCSVIFLFGRFLILWSLSDSCLVFFLFLLVSIWFVWSFDPWCLSSNCLIPFWFLFFQSLFGIFLFSLFLFLISFSLCLVSFWFLFGFFYDSWLVSSVSFLVYFWFLLFSFWFPFRLY